MFYLFVFWCSLMNRARGSQFWNMLPSTSGSRIAAMLGITTAAVVLTGNIWFLGLWPLLLAWAIPAWDAYWSAEFGHDKQHSKLWGFLMMSLRMSLIAPTLFYISYLVGSSYWIALAFPLLAVPYLLFGLIKNNPYIIAYSEYSVGAMLGILLAKAMGI